MTLTRGGKLDEAQVSLKYIPDWELDLDTSEDLLATRPYVDVLERTVIAAEPPFTIGLYGSWGSGKSSVAATVCRRLRESEPGVGGVATFTYDAWKYSGESLYRSFILQLRDEFGLDADQQLKEFYQDTTSDVGHDVALSKTFWPTLLSWSPLLVLVVLLIRQQTDMTVLVALLAVLVTVLAQVVRSSLTTYTVTVNQPRTFAAEQFAAAFGAAIDEVLGVHKEGGWFRKRQGPAQRRVLVVVDNIDRCDGETAKNLLMSIKNFLERPGVVFLLPLDPDAVKRFLNLGDPEGSEYLRKIFNASISIRRFTPSELYDFTQRLNEKYELGLPAAAVSLVCQEFATNPRRIIQFLNTLQNELALAVEQERDGLIGQGTVTDNVVFLAKLLVLREEWPDFFQQLSLDTGMLRRVNQAISEGRYLLKQRGANRRAEDDLPELPPNLYLFLMRSQTITAPSLDPFLVNRDRFLGVPDALYELVISQSWDDIAQGIESEDWTLEQVIRLALDVGDTEVIKRGLMLTVGYNVLGVFGAMLADTRFSDDAESLLGEDETHRLAAMCASRDVDEVFDTLVPERLVALTRFLFDRAHRDLHDRLISHLVAVVSEDDADAA